MKTQARTISIQIRKLQGLSDCFRQLSTAQATSADDKADVDAFKWWAADNYVRIDKAMKEYAKSLENSPDVGTVNAHGYRLNTIRAAFARRTKHGAPATLTDEGGSAHYDVPESKRAALSKALEAANAAHPEVKDAQKRLDAAMDGTVAVEIACIEFRRFPVQVNGMYAQYVHEFLMRPPLTPRRGILQRVMALFGVEWPTPLKKVESEYIDISAQAGEMATQLDKISRLIDDRNHVRITPGAYGWSSVYAKVAAILTAVDGGKA